jgi:hypothetical protein
MLGTFACEENVVLHKVGCSLADFVNSPVLKPHCIRCSHFKVDDVRALEASSKPTVRIVDDNVTASLH